jgi:hypothetical protein
MEMNKYQFLDLTIFQICFKETIIAGKLTQNNAWIPLEAGGEERVNNYHSVYSKLTQGD